MPNPPALTIRLSQPDGATYHLNLTSPGVGEQSGTPISSARAARMGASSARCAPRRQRREAAWSALYSTKSYPFDPLVFPSMPSRVRNSVRLGCRTVSSRPAPIS